jgi:hypothetical protein
MPGIKSLIKNKLEVMDLADQELMKAVEKAEPAIMKQVNEILSKLPTKKGLVYAETKEYKKIVSQFIKAIEEGLQKGGYNSAVSKYLRSFNEIDSYNAKIQSELSDLSLSEIKKVVGPIREQAIENVLNNLLGTGMDQSMLQPMREALFKQIVGGTTVEDMKEFLRLNLMSTGETNGIIWRSVAQQSRDAVYQYDGMINQKIAQEYSMNAIDYVGSIAENSRPLCRKLVKLEIIPLEDLDYIIKNTPKDGLIKGTNASNFMVNRGGHNCRHAAIPRRLSPKELESAKQKVRK